MTLGDAFTAVARSHDVLKLIDGPPLDEADAERRGRLARAQDREDFTAVRRAALLLMGHLRGVPASALEIHQLCDHCGGRHGRPRIPNTGNLDVSWSHHQGTVAVAIGPGRIGVDVLAAHPRPPLPSAAVMTQVEALFKTGAGTLDDLLRQARRPGAPELTSQVHFSDTNQRVTLQTVGLHNDVTVSVASTCRTRFVTLDYLRRNECYF
ncbi:hypothetical protein [Pseudarthrobacter sp. NamE5]|uniref:hypothetical protein n=1 Tax=Pseudarthrobacter sp. NamE5 TaxID=2576839 RepID=UPI00110BCD04|nr:hypothetical protein [Pseudarthrobacter sp. NamE5]TLM80922.1 hypothetical protein FDW84_19040 [Pseudarthrobacter sp. NamE5]